MRFLTEALGRYGHWVSAFLYLIAALVLVDFKGPFEIDADEGYNLAKAALVAAGEPLYTSIWSDQPPLLTLLLAGLQGIFPGSVDAARLLILMHMFVLVACVHAAAAKIAGGGRPLAQTRLPRLLAGFSAAMLLTTSDTMIRTSFAVDVGTPSVTLAAASSFLLVVAWPELRPGPLFASGALLGLACGAKLFVAFLGPVLLVLVLAAGVWQGRRCRRLFPAVLRSSGWWVGGLLAALLVIFGPGLSPEMMEQLAAPHLKAQDLGVPSLPVWIFRANTGVYALAVLALPILAVTARVRAIPFAAWLMAGSSALYLHRPIFPSHGWLVLVPAVVLGGSAVGSLATQRGRFAKLTRPLALVLVVALGSVSIPPLLTWQHWDTGSESSAFYPAVMSHLDGYQGRFMVTSRPMLAFRAGLFVPPELAVTSNKRFGTGLLNVAQIMRGLQKPDTVFLFEDPRWPAPVRKAVRRRAATDYCRVMVHARARLHKRRRLAQPGECLE